MSERKPPGLSWESWIDRQILEGEEHGAFEGLEGHGKPIRDLERPHDEDWWIRAKLAREDVATTPPTIAIRLDRDASVARAMTAADEGTVRTIIHELNDRIRAINRSATWGPPSSIGPLDADSVVERWRSVGGGAVADQASYASIEAEEDSTQRAPAGPRRRRFRGWRTG